MTDQLRKTPYETDELTSALIGSAPTSPEPHWKHLKTKKVGRLYHHIFTDPEIETKNNIHILSAHADPSKRGYSRVKTYIGHPEDTWRVHSSNTHPDHRGRGYAGKLYRSVIAHHGKLTSDINLSPAADRVWGGLMDDKNIDVDYGNPDFGDVHVATWKGKRLQKHTLGEKPFAHGWVSPEGKYHEQAPDESHLMFRVPENHPHAGIHPVDLYEHGWISVGHGGGHGIEAHSSVIGNHDHPAMKTIRKLAGQLPSDKFVHAFAVDTNRGYDRRVGSFKHVGIGGTHSGRIAQMRHDPLMMGDRTANDLNKAPYQTDASSLEALESAGPPNPLADNKYYSKDFPKATHHKTTRLIEGVYHHHHTRIMPGSIEHYHVISRNKNPAADGVAVVRGHVHHGGDGTLNVIESWVDSSQRGKNYGKMAYLAALVHHKKIASDHHTSGAADRAWDHITKVPGVRGKMADTGSYRDDQSHEARAIRTKPIREHLKTLLREPRQSEFDFKKTETVHGDFLHGTLSDHASSIGQHGLKPHVGRFVEEMYGEYKPRGRVYLAHSGRPKNAITAMQYHVSRKLNKPMADVSDEDIERHGAIAVVDGDHGRRLGVRPNQIGVALRRARGDHSLPNRGPKRGLPTGVEPGDYTWTDRQGGSLPVKRVMTGKELAEFVRDPGRFTAKPRPPSPQGDLFKWQNEWHGDLFHGTLRDHVDNIKREGLKPKTGSITKQYFGKFGRIPKKVFLADSGDADRSIWIMQQHIGKKLGKHPDAVTHKDIEQHGAIFVVDKHHARQKGVKNHPPLTADVKRRDGRWHGIDPKGRIVVLPLTVEDNDRTWTGRKHQEGLKPKHTLVGKELVRFVRHGYRQYTERKPNQFAQEEFNFNRPISKMISSECRDNLRKALTTKKFGPMRARPDQLRANRGDRVVRSERIDSDFVYHHIHRHPGSPFESHKHLISRHEDPDRPGVAMLDGWVDPKNPTKGFHINALATDKAHTDQGHENELVHRALDAHGQVRSAKMPTRLEEAIMIGIGNRPENEFIRGQRNTDERHQLRRKPIDPVR